MPFTDELRRYDTTSSPDERRRIELDLAARYQTTGAVLILDMSGFSMSVRENGIVSFLAKIYRMRDFSSVLLSKWNGSVVKFEADNLFAYFPGTGQAGLSRAINFAGDINRHVLHDNQSRQPQDRILVSIGIAYGSFLFLPSGHDYFGDCVNVASKLGEDIATAGDILVAHSQEAELAAESLQELGSISYSRRSFSVSGVTIDALAIKAPC